MVLVKLEAAPTYRALDVGATLFGFPVVATVPGSPQFIVDVPPAALDRLGALVAAGDVVDYRPAYADYTPLWLPSSVTPQAQFAPGDTFPLHGVTEATRARGRYGAGVIVAVCDTGVDARHQAFAGKAVLGDTQDGHGHGTHVASTAASAWGIASDATILSRNVLPGGRGTEAQIANGIRQAADYVAGQRAPGVLNLSLGGTVSSVIDDAVRYAQQRGVVVCAAAGNGGGAPIGSPARAADLIVMACDRARAWASFTDGRGWPHPHRVGAQGVEIVAARAGSGSGTLQASGTSMACPHVVGCVALLLAAGLTPRAAKEAMGHG